MQSRTPYALFLLSVALGCSGDDAPDDPDAGAMGPDAQTASCVAWEIDYDLSGSQFEIANTPFNAGDAVVDIGPGQLTLRFTGDDSGPLPGPVSMLAYTMAMEFSISDVETDIDVASGPEDCGIAEGTMTSTRVTWSSPLRDYASTGFVTCNASEVVCAFAGLEPGVPAARDSTSDQMLMPFVLSATVGTDLFTMDSVEVPNDDAGDTFLRLRGEKIADRCVMELPSCP